tara:strand:+ start:117 stop:1601 length:1485 start_codon:yes stop_codon:yes gene_type:complete
LATPPAGTRLSLGKLGRATAVDNANYTTKTSLNSCARDSSTGKASLSDFYISAVVNSLDGYPYVDEQTNEIYELTFTNANSLFASRIAARADNFTWTTSNSSLFDMSGTEDVTTQYNASAIADSTTPGTLESTLVTDGAFTNWSGANLDDWTESGTISENESGATGSAVQFESDGAYIEQSFTVKGNSTYQIYTSGKSANAGNSNFDITISGSQDQNTYVNTGTGTDWTQFREDFYTSGSVGVTQTLKIKIEANIVGGINPSLDTVRFQRWEGAHFSDTNVTITGKYSDDGQSDGYNDHATRYNTAISKVVEIQDTYGGLAIACFLPGTLILMADDTAKPIEEIDVGDEVMSLDLPGLPDEDLGYLEWKAFTMRPMDASDLELLIEQNKKTAFVENLFYDYMNGYYSINNGYLKVTAEHDLFAYSKGNWGWRTPKELSEGMLLLNFLGEMAKVESIEWVPGEVEVLNFDVEPLDVYFAGGVLVHNKGASSDPGS